MSNALAEYLAALEARDAREKAQEQVINHYTKLADRSAAARKSVPPASEQPPTASSSDSKTLRPSTPAGGANVAQMRAELAATQKTRGALEAQVSTLSAELSALKVTDAEQKKRIAQLESHKLQLERRMKDRADELKGKGSLVEHVQDELVALNLQLNMAEKEKERLQKENAELTRRWVEKMESEAKKMNDQMGWESKRRK